MERGETHVGRNPSRVERDGCFELLESSGIVLQSGQGVGQDELSIEVPGLLLQQRRSNALRIVVAAGPQEVLRRLQLDVASLGKQVRCPHKLAQGVREIAKTFVRVCELGTGLAVTSHPR